MRYKLDFSESVKAVAEKYVEIYHTNNDVRSNHKSNMNTLDSIGKSVPVFKQIVSCIETILWIQDQPDVE